MRLRWLTTVLVGVGLLTACAQPNPTAIAFTLRLNDQWDLFTSDTEGNDVAQLTDTPEMEIDPRWSPDGTRIAFATFNPHEGAPRGCHDSQRPLHRHSG